MGLFYCVPSACAEVRYKPYQKAGGIRYRYSGEDWVTVDGDDFTIQLGGTVTGASIIYFDCQKLAFRNNNGTLEYLGQTTINTSIVFGNNNFTAFLPIQPYKGETRILEGRKVCDRFGILHRSKFRPDLEPTWGVNTSPTALTQSRNDIVYGLLPNSAVVTRYRGRVTQVVEWILKIYKSEQVVYTNTSSERPEVEYLDEEDSLCELSDRTQVIRIEKTPFLRRIEVTPYDYQNFGASVFRRDIPDNCLAVRNNYTATIPPLPGGIPTPSNSPLNQDYTYGFVQLICSDEGCPPPEYEVICNCEGEECPPGTCPHECNGTVCCYDLSTGQSVEEIPLENYRGGDI